MYLVKRISEFALEYSISISRLTKRGVSQYSVHMDGQYFCDVYRMVSSEWVTIVSIFLFCPVFIPSVPFLISVDLEFFCVIFNSANFQFSKHSRVLEFRSEYLMK